MLYNSLQLPVLPSHFSLALRTLHSRLAGTGILWALTGSTSFVLQGLPLTPNDVDLQTDALGAYEIEHLFIEHATRPIEFSSTGSVRSHFGELNLCGVEIEIMGDMQHRLPDGTWTHPPDLRPLIRFIEWEGLEVPVLSLEYEADAYLELGRLERAVQLKNFFQR